MIRIYLLLLVLLTDLDGDLYQLILLDRLIPESTIPDSKVMEHNGDTPRKIGRPAGPADIAKNVVNFMVS